MSWQKGDRKNDEKRCECEIAFRFSGVKVIAVVIISGKIKLKGVYLNKLPLYNKFTVRINK